MSIQERLEAKFEYIKLEELAVIFEELPFDEKFSSRKEQLVVLRAGLSYKKPREVFDYLSSIVGCLDGSSIDKVNKAVSLMYIAAELDYINIYNIDSDAKPLMIESLLILDSSYDLKISEKSVPTPSFKPGGMKWLKSIKSSYPDVKEAARNEKFLNILNSIEFKINRHPVYPLKGSEESQRNIKLKQADVNAIIQEFPEYLSNPVHFSWFFDERGRSYPYGYHITPMGDDYDKSILSFEDEELIEIDEGLSNLDKVQVAIKLPKFIRRNVC